MIASKRGVAAAILVAASGVVSTAAAAETSETAASRVVVSIHASHDEVLPAWLAAIDAGTVRAPAQVIHFDAHPDLAPPQGLPTPADPLAGVDIASFQLSAVFLGAVDRIVWLRPSWTFQLPDGEHELSVGRSNDRLRVDSSFDYYVLDDGWAPLSQLEDAKTLSLQVVPLAGYTPTDVGAAGDWILDIDLDGFGSRNPAADALRIAGADEENLELIRRIFDPTRLELPEEPAARVAALEELLGAAERAGGGGISAIGGVYQLWQAGVELSDLGSLAWVLLFELDAPGDFIAENGRFAVALPEHRPDAEEIARTADALAALVVHAGRPPALVTVARSEADGYTSRSVAVGSEQALLGALAQVLPEAQVVFAPGLGPVPAPTSARNASGTR